MNLTGNQNVQKMQKCVVNLSENVPNFTKIPMGESLDKIYF
jgi:hypothetical protein